LAHFGERQLRQRAVARDAGVMVDYDGSVTRRVDVELDPIGVEADRPPERGARVFVLIAGRTPMGDNAGSSHDAIIARLNKSV
jgi:hypothetical protein